MPNGPTPEVIPEPVGDPLPLKPEPKSEPKPDPKPIEVPQATRLDPHPLTTDSSENMARGESVWANPASGAFPMSEPAGGVG